MTKSNFSKFGNTTNTTILQLKAYKVADGTSVCVSQPWHGA